MNRRMKLIFTVSILLNIVFIGVGAGMFYRFCQERIDIPGSMTPEARHFMAMTFQKGRDEVKPLIKDVKEQRKAVEKVITAETFDLEAYKKVTAAMLDTRDDITRKRAEIMGEALVELPLEDRKKFARRVIDGLEGRRPHRGGYHKKMMDKEGVPRSPEEGDSRAKP